LVDGQLTDFLAQKGAPGEHVFERAVRQVADKQTPKTLFTLVDERDWALVPGAVSNRNPLGVMLEFG
jgi:hypothetical protein